jgi:hypothetical protein
MVSYDHSTFEKELLAYYRASVETNCVSVVQKVTMQSELPSALIYNIAVQSSIVSLNESSMYMS